MLKSIILSFLIIICFFSCKEQAPKPSKADYKAEVASLSTVKSRIGYLSEIFESDQSIRGQQFDSEYDANGNPTKETLEHYERQDSIDRINALKIDAYLDEYDHPDKAIYGEVATQTPWAVIHHSKDIDFRLSQFDNLFLAYKNGHIDANAFSFYLQRTHEDKFGTRIRMKSPYKPEAEIDSLISALGLKKPSLQAYKQ